MGMKGVKDSRGRVNADGEVNVLDVVAIVSIVLGNVVPTESQMWAADLDGNGVINIIDAIELVNIMFGAGH